MQIKEDSFKQSMGCTAVKPEFLRAPLARSFPFLSTKLPSYLEKQLAEETEQELKSLRERSAATNRKVNGKDTFAVKTRVAEKYHDIFLQNGLKTELWQLSERLLGILRTPGLCPLPDVEATNKAIRAFVQNIENQTFPEIDPESPFYIGPRGYTEIKSPDVIGPNAYFIQTQPDLVRNYGFPFFSTVPSLRPPGDISVPIAERVFGINTIFWASLAGGDKRLGHDVVYYAPEGRFYFLDPVLDRYLPTSDSKLRIGISLAIQRVAGGLVVEQASIILNKFLADSVLDQILAKSKTLLSVGNQFFAGPNAKPRFIQEDQTANSISNTVKAFIESQVEVDEANILTISECMAQFQSFCQERGESIPSYKEIKVVVQMKVRELFGVGLRNDLLLEDNRRVAGWKGLRLDHQVV